MFTDKCPYPNGRGPGFKKPKFINESMRLIWNSQEGGESKQKHLSWEGCEYLWNNLHVLQRIQDSDKCLSHLRLAALFDMLSLKTKHLTSNNKFVQINDK